MKDIGFGLIDQRTVIIVLVTMVLMQFLPGFQIPVDIQNAGNLFVGLVWLTGYIYLARTIYRLPIALLISLALSIQSMKRLFNGMGDSDDEQNERDETGKIPTSDGVSNMPKKKVRNENKFIKGIKNILQLIVIILLIPLIFLWELLTNIFTFGIWIEHKSVLTWNMPRPISDFYRKHGNFLDAIFGIFDRVGVVLIAVIATMPYFLNFTKVIGMSGLIAMVVIFTLRGNFSALIKDIVEKEEDEKKREAKKKVENSRSSPLFVEVVNSNESPIEIKNSKYNPLIIDSDYYNPIPVNIVKGIENSSSNPLSVQVVNGVQVFSYDSIPVEVTNIVTTQQDD